MSDAESELFGIVRLNVQRLDIPAITHVDYSAMVQTVHKETNPRYHALPSAFKEQTGCSVLVDTSFNVRGEPGVNIPEDAFCCFIKCRMKTRFVGNCILREGDQNPGLAIEYKAKFALD